MGKAEGGNVGRVGCAGWKLASSVFFAVLYCLLIVFDP